MKPLEWDASKTVAENAREKLPELAGLFFEEGADAADPETPFGAIHHFRLVTKRFRYTLELFGDYYGPGLDRHIESLKALQQLLGALSDCTATRDLLANRKDLGEPELVRLQQKLERLTRVRAGAFRRGWKKNFSPARQRSWLNFLSQRRR